MAIEKREGKFRNSDGQTGYQWMCQLFAYERCEECGKGANGHIAVPFLGNWFAACKEPKLEVGE